jgi:hypothetical protein
LYVPLALGAMRQKTHQLVFLEEFYDGIEEAAGLNGD